MRLFTAFECPQCRRPMTRADYNYSVDLHREGRCAPCQWDLAERRWKEKQYTLSESGPSDRIVIAA